MGVNDLLLTGFKYVIQLHTYMSKFGQKCKQDALMRCGDSKKRLAQCKPLLTGVAQTLL